MVITLAIRTPLTKARRGGFKDTPLDGILVKLLKEVAQRMEIDPELVEDICVGNVCFVSFRSTIPPLTLYQVNHGSAACMARAAALAAGFPITGGAYSVNRFCSSGLKAIQDIANQISEGAISCGLAVGAESMSIVPQTGQPLQFVDEIMAKPDAADCLQPMGQTSENVAKDFGVTRDLQDRYAAESFRRAEVAQKAGWFDDEIVPITTTVVDPTTKESKSVVLTKDEGPRWGTTFEALGKVRPAFPAFGTTSTGGNSSQVTDGAAAVLLMRRDMAERLKRPILGKFVAATVAGVPPRIMGIGPTAAVPKLLSQLGITLDDVDVVELNEAFASMAVYCKDTLKIPHHKMNPRGGAIALGHPLGATGARQVVTGLSECRRLKKRVLLTSMCIGSGQGMAGLFVNEQL